MIIISQKGICTTNPSVSATKTRDKNPGRDPGTEGGGTGWVTAGDTNGAEGNGVCDHHGDAGAVPGHPCPAGICHCLAEGTGGARGIFPASPIPLLLFSHSVTALSAGAMEIDVESLWLAMELP